MRRHGENNPHCWVWWQSVFMATMSEQKILWHKNRGGGDPFQHSLIVYRESGRENNPKCHKAYWRRDPVYTWPIFSKGQVTESLKMGGKEKSNNPSLVRKVASRDLPDVWVCLPVKAARWTAPPLLQVWNILKVLSHLRMQDSLSNPVEVLPTNPCAVQCQAGREGMQLQCCSAVSFPWTSHPHQSFLVLLLQGLVHSSSDMKVVGCLCSGKPVTKTPLSSTNTHSHMSNDQTWRALEVKTGQRAHCEEFARSDLDECHPGHYHGFSVTRWCAEWPVWCNFPWVLVP